MSDDQRLYAKVGDEFVPVKPAGELFTVADGKLVSDHVWVIESGHPTLFVDRRALAPLEFRNILRSMFP